MLYRLYKLMNSGSNIFSGLVEGFKKGPKGIIKSLFLILFAIYVFGVMIGMYSFYMIATYKYLAASGNQQFMPLISMMVAVAIIMFFGFTSVASSYYTGTGEEFLMSLPLTPGQFLAQSLQFLLYQMRLWDWECLQSVPLSTDITKVFLQIRFSILDF